VRGLDRDVSEAGNEAAIAAVTIERLLQVRQDMRGEISGNLDLRGEAAINGMPF